MWLPIAILVALCLTPAGVPSDDGDAPLWLDVPFVRQEKNACGAACVAMIMQYWAKVSLAPPPASADPAVIMERLYARDAGGIFASDMKRYFDEEGFNTFVFKGEWLDLAQHLSKGRPLIVCLRDNPREDALHYTVIAGLDPRQDTVLLNDPARRKLAKMDRARFERRWHAANNWTLLALPRQSR